MAETHRSCNARHWEVGRSDEACTQPLGHLAPHQWPTDMLTRAQVYREVAAQVHELPRDLSPQQVARLIEVSASQIEYVPGRLAPSA